MDKIMEALPTFKNEDRDDHDKIISWARRNFPDHSIKTTGNGEDFYIIISPHGFPQNSLILHYNTWYPNQYDFYTMQHKPIKEVL